MVYQYHLYTGPTGGSTRRSHRGQILVLLVSATVVDHHQLGSDQSSSVQASNYGWVVLEAWVSEWKFGTSRGLVHRIATDVPSRKLLGPSFHESRNNTQDHNHWQNHNDSHSTRHRTALWPRELTSIFISTAALISMVISITSPLPFISITLSIFTQQQSALARRGAHSVPRQNAHATPSITKASIGTRNRARGNTTVRPVLAHGEGEGESESKHRVCCVVYRGVEWRVLLVGIGYRPKRKRNEASGVEKMGGK